MRLKKLNQHPSKSQIVSLLFSINSKEISPQVQNTFNTIINQNTFTENGVFYGFTQKNKIQHLYSNPCQIEETHAYKEAKGKIINSLFNCIGTAINLNKLLKYYDLETDFNNLNGFISTLDNNYINNTKQYKSYTLKDTSRLKKKK